MAEERVLEMNVRTSEQARGLHRDTQQRYVRFFLEFAQQHRSDPAALEEELSNIIVAADLCLEQGNWQLLAKFTRTLGDYWVRLGLWHAYTRYSRPVLSQSLLESSERAEILGRLAIVEEARGNYAEARTLYSEQLQLHKSVTGSDNSVIAALRELVRLAMLQGDYGDAQQLLEYRLGIAQERQSAKEKVDTWLELAALQQERNDLDKAESLCQQALAVAQDMGYRVGIVDAFRQKASVSRSQKDCEGALELYQAALDAALEIGDQIRACQIREDLTALGAAMDKKVFISYSHHDRHFVERLAWDLKTTGLPVWWDQWEIKVGDSIIRKVSDGIRESAHLAVALSPHSVQSDWVQRELGSALMQQLSADRNITILPIMVSDCEVPVLLREIKWADFRHDYEAGLQELLDALTEGRG